MNLDLEQVIAMLQTIAEEKCQCDFHNIDGRVLMLLSPHYRAQIQACIIGVQAIIAIRAIQVVIKRAH